MTKEYQNGDVEEYEEINHKLMLIYGKNDSFLVNCYGGGYYACIFAEKPPKGVGILSGRI